MTVADLCAEFGLKSGLPEDPEDKASLSLADNRWREFLRRHNRERGNYTEAELRELDASYVYEPAGLLQSPDWWYIPCGWIGCFGFIINKNDSHINWLGSFFAMTWSPLQLCFWGHNHGLYCDLVDFTFAPNTSMQLAGRLLRHFQPMAPDAQGRTPERPRPYDESEIEHALASQFPTFKNHYVYGNAIREIKRAYENETLRFTSTWAEK
ncbi:MAG TPA: hypothetical protein VG733_10305 [Chthoniobacteraceae bacterium]|nr:hypothetical protein [Chthoniobacteraceae bacterium]